VFKTDFPGLIPESEPRKMAFQGKILNGIFDLRPVIERRVRY
jgi:hypothetical protein